MNQTEEALEKNSLTRWLMIIAFLCASYVVSVIPMLYLTARLFGSSSTVFGLVYGFYSPLFNVLVKMGFEDAMNAL